MSRSALTFPALAVALAAAAAVAGGAQAASHALQVFMQEQDLNKDGKVTKEEFQKGRAERFAATDADRDGGLSKTEYVDEFAARLQTQVAALPADKREEEKVRQLRQADVRFGVLDSDKNGRLSTAEYAASGWTFFAMHDADKDGFVTLGDAKAAEAADKTR